MPGTASRFIPPKTSSSVPHNDWYPPPGASADRTPSDRFARAGQFTCSTIAASRSASSRWARSKDYKPCFRCGRCGLLRKTLTDFGTTGQGWGRSPGQKSRSGSSETETKAHLMENLTFSECASFDHTFMLFVLFRSFSPSDVRSNFVATQARPRHPFCGGVDNR
jgi:hypothetical protein